MEQTGGKETGGHDDKYSMSRIYVNRSDRISGFMEKVKPISDFEDFGAHGTPDSLIYETTSGEKYGYSIKCLQ